MDTTDWRSYREEKQQRHRRWAAQNLAVIQASSIPYQDRGNTVLFREEGKPQVDFYLSTGRWRCKGQTYKGGAERFLVWYRKQVEK